MYDDVVLLGLVLTKRIFFCCPAVWWIGKNNLLLLILLLHLVWRLPFPLFRLRSSFEKRFDKWQRIQSALKPTVNFFKLFFVPMPFFNQVQHLLSGHFSIYIKSWQWRFLSHTYCFRYWNIGSHGYFQIVYCYYCSSERHFLLQLMNTLIMLPPYSR